MCSSTSRTGTSTRAFAAGTSREPRMPRHHDVYREPRSVSLTVARPVALPALVPLIVPVRRSTGPWQRAWRRLLRDRVAMGGGTLLLVIAAIALLVPLIMP